VTADFLEDEVAAFVADFTSHPIKQIKPQTTLFGDLGIDGDDGDEILSTFMQRFAVDMSSYRPIHFGPEGFVPWAPLYWLVILWRTIFEKNSTPESRSRLMPITIQDLIDSAKAKQWTIRYEKRG
jgi:hypothetical protein